MDQINNTQKSCATCGYWLGTRHPERLGFVIVNSKMDKGQCASHALTEHYMTQACYSCSRFSKWRVLR